MVSTIPEISEDLAVTNLSARGNYGTLKAAMKWTTISESRLTGKVGQRGIRTVYFARACVARQAGNQQGPATAGAVAENRRSGSSRRGAAMTGARQLGCWAASRACARAASMTWALLLVPACFHPSYDHPACGPNGECPSGWTCNAQLICDHDSSASDASLLDVSATIDGSPGTVCYGPAGWQACFDPAPSGNVNLPGTINTDGGAPCLATQPMGWAAPQPTACFIVGDTITVPAGGTNVNGHKPLVLVARSLITITGVLDVASRRGETGTPPSECQPFSKDPNVPGGGVGGGGGAGGSFMTRAGGGGNGDGGAQNGQASDADAAVPTHLRGGCVGQAGGALIAGDAGTSGAGGGSVYLVSGGEIVIATTGSGRIDDAGGGGGGSGGMIVLYSTTLTVPAGPVLIANGGGGSGGSQSQGGAKGGDGSDPSVASPLAAAAGGGNGGQGYPVAALNDLDGTGGTAGTGGGGGGGGGAAGYIRSNKPLTAAIVSPPATIVP